MEPARESLRQLLAATPRLAPGRAVRLCADLLGGLSTVHGGLDPDHVLVGDGVRVMAASGEPRAEYLAPEQALGEPADARTDVYAAGVLLYEMLAGKKPFEGRNRAEVVNALLVREPAPLREIPDELATVVRRALAKRPAERYATPAEMRAELEAQTLADGTSTPDVVEAVADGETAAAATDEPGPRATVPALHAIATPEPAPEAAGPRAPARPPRTLAIAVGTACLLGLVLWVALRASGEAPGGTAPANLVSRLQATIDRGELSAARADAEKLAKAYPRDARAFASLGHVLFAQGEKERGLAAYREAQRLDPRVGPTPDLLANLRATFADPEHGEAAFRLAETIGAPAQPILSDLAVHTADARLKRRAAEAAGRISRGDSSP